MLWNIKHLINQSPNSQSKEKALPSSIMMAQADQEPALAILNITSFPDLMGSLWTQVHQTFKDEFYKCILAQCTPG